MKTKLETLQAQLISLQDDASAIETQIDNFELDESDYEDSYIEALDCEGTITAGGLEFCPSRILSELDPIAYNCGLSDYVDSMDKEESEDYKELTEELENLTSEIEALEEEIEELEEEIEAGIEEA